MYHEGIFLDIFFRDWNLPMSLLYVFESSGVAYVDVFHSSTHRLAFSLNWHRSVVEQGSSVMNTLI